MSHDHGHTHGHDHGHDHGEPLVALIKWGWRKVSPAERRKRKTYARLATAIADSDNPGFAALLDAGADVSFTPGNKPAIALLCIERGTPEMLKSLLQHGLDPNTPLTHTLTDEDKARDVIEERCPMLSHAIETGRAAMAMTLLNDPRIKPDKGGVTIRSESRGYHLQFHPSPLGLARRFNMARIARKLEERTPGPPLTPAQRKAPGQPPRRLLPHKT